MRPIHRLAVITLSLSGVLFVVLSPGGHEPAAVHAANQPTPPSPKAVSTRTFKKTLQPFLQQFCVDCHNQDDLTSGIRVDHLTGAFPDSQLRLWDAMYHQIESGEMPPKDESQPSADQRNQMLQWIQDGLTAARSRVRENNGSVRRLTIRQYQNTLQDLLGLDDDLTSGLPPDAVSKDGFVNNEQTLLLSPLLIESYFNIAEQALDRCIVDETKPPTIQNFRMDLGKSINQNPSPDKLILGALSTLLPNADFQVTELTPDKPYAFEPLRMQTAFKFIEGYQGNSTVRGWREYNSIYHAVFACMRGTNGYPKGHAYQTVREGLLLRPAIPSAELFQIESTYGPKANFKISLRELPDEGNFRVTVHAARYDDALLLESDSPAQNESSTDAITVTSLAEPQVVPIESEGIYQADVYVAPPLENVVKPDDSKLDIGLIGAWPLNQNAHAKPKHDSLQGQLQGGAQYVESPFGHAISLDGNDDSVVVNRNDSMNVGTGDFSVAAWIRPTQLRQGGIVCLGKYSWTHGWYLDMPNNQGVLRIETAGPNNQSNGTVASRPGIIRVNTWQHVAAVIRRGTNQTNLYLNGYLVATGTINDGNLDNPTVNLHIGRIQESKLFKGDIDEVHIYRRALELSEIQALLEPGRSLIQPPVEKPENLTLKLGSRQFSATLHQPAFMTVRIGAGPLPLEVQYAGGGAPHRVVLTRLEDTNPMSVKFRTFEKRAPHIGVHVGLRRDCGSTLTAVGMPQTVSGTNLQKYVFEGAIGNYPSPDVEENNVNYLAGIREIGVRSEYTDGRDMPRLLIQSVEFEGPYYKTWPPETHQNIFIESEHKDQPAVYARELILDFATRAFRRPVSNTEIDSLMAVWKSSYADSANFSQSVQDTLLVILTAPQFLFMIENSHSPKPELLDDYELASKLSYFLWNRPPDRRLLEQAANRKLHSTLDSETKRMIQDPRFEEFASEFTSQWLSLDKLDVVEIDRGRYPRLTRDTRTELRKEPVKFLQYLIQHNLPLSNLIESNFILANETVADYYGLADHTESGFEFVPITHQTDQLGGILSQAGILAGLSDGRESNPVKRGAWFARKIIAEPPDDPPPNVPELDEDTSNLSLKERLFQHRNQTGCIKCHAGIDPWGLPFETFDAAGRFKSVAQVDSTSTLPDGTSVQNLNELKQYLTQKRLDQVAFSYLKNQTSYAIGRSRSYNELVVLK
ncbi:MAG: DUF1592 domain-containing protein [Planctomycetota bacterium]|nr:DUF1592 domain-containing protein [Planctomycetota bacterium]